MTDLTTLIDVTGSLTFVGFAESTPQLAQSSTVWQILRVNEATSGTIIAYADGVATFTKRWTNRSTFNYTVS